MCLIAFAIHADPACPLLIAANRDEALDRPTAPLHRWTLPDGQEVVGGRDLRDGGTWLGVTPAGRVAMLTNVREGVPVKGERSRGELVTRWLMGDIGWDTFGQGLEPHAYGGFNLVVGDFSQGFWACISNRDPQRPHHDSERRLHAQPLGSGVYGLSNAALDTPWPKTQRLKAALARSLAELNAPGRQEDGGLETLTQALGQALPAETGELPQTGVPDAIEQALSSAFVRLPQGQYGTRSSLVMRVSAMGVDEGWQVRLDEWTHEHGSSMASTSEPASFLARNRRSETLRW